MKGKKSNVDVKIRVDSIFRLCIYLILYTTMYQKLHWNRKSQGGDHINRIVV